MKKGLIGILFLVLIKLGAFAQTKVYVVGSSTAAGTGADPISQSFVNRLAAYYTDVVFTNLAIPGTTTYHALPTGTINPPNRPAVDVNMNITRAVAEGADIILVSFPTNDIANGFSNDETITNLQAINQYARSNNRSIYFLGSQPRNTFTRTQQDAILDLNNRIMTTFPNNSINVYPLIVAPDGYTIDPIVSAGDGIHVNNEGHRRLYQKVVDYNIFSPAAVVLPVTLTTFKAEKAGKAVKLSWETSAETNNSHFLVERSPDNADFAVIKTIKGKGNSYTRNEYSCTDASPLAGKNYYRLTQVDMDGRKKISKTILSNFSNASTTNIFPVPAFDQLNIAINSISREPIQFSIINLNGARVASYQRTLISGNNAFQIPVTSLARGQYIMQIHKPSGDEHLSFIKR